MLTVRRGQLSDLPAVLEMLTHVWEDDYVPECWADWVSKPEEGVVLVALLGEQIIGTCYVHFQGEDQCWFQALRVHPDHRRLGVGSALTERSLTEALSDGRRVAYLGIDADNTASLTMTARAGFGKVVAYQRLHADLSEAQSSGRWRTATAEDAAEIHAMIRTHAERCSIPHALFTHWEWQELSQRAVADAIGREELWIWEGGQSIIASGINLHDDEVGVFAPIYVNTDDLIVALQSLRAGTSQRGAKRMELWLPVDDPTISDLVQRFGFSCAADDAYVIWSYELQRK